MRSINARTKSPRHFRFAVNQAISVPADAESVDIACSFSVFTHLLHHESFMYLKDMHRALKHGGKLVFSFLEFAAPQHWVIFEETANAKELPHLNMFIERNAIQTWAEKLGFEIERFVGCDERVGDEEALGQSAVVLRKP